MQTVSGSFGVLAYAIGALFGNVVLIYVGAVLVLLFSILPAFLIAEPRTLPTTAAQAASTTHHVTLGGVLRIMQPLWAFLAYDLVAMGYRLAGAKPPGHLLEIVFGVIALVLIVQALGAKDRDPLYSRETLVDYRKVLAANSLSWIGMQTMFVYMIAFAQQRFPMLDDEGTGRLLSMSFLCLNAVAALLPALVLLPLANRHGVVRVHTISLATMAAGFAGVYAFADTPLALYALMAFMGIGWAAIVSLPFSIMSQRVDPSRIGLYMGVFNLSIVLPQLVVSLGVGTYIGQAADKGIIFLIGAVSLALSALAWSRVAEIRGEAPAAVTVKPAH
jgi:hypothetical protein